MTTVREETIELLRAHGMTTIFGNPGSTELAMLAGLPDDFTYVLGLQELVVIGMADGFAQASGRPAHANLHTAPGVGNAVGGILNAQANRAPLLITAGQQARPQVTIEATLTNRAATLVPAPYVKYSHEPLRAQDVPTAIARAIHHAMLPPRGPAFVSIPMDDWSAQADADRSRNARGRVVHGRVAPDPEALAHSPPACAPPPRHCSSSAPTSTPRARGTMRWRSPSPSEYPCGRRRSPAAHGSAFPSRTRSSPESCRPRSDRSPRRSPATTSWSSSAPRCSRTTPTCRDRCCPRGPSWCCSPPTRPTPHGPRWATRSSATSPWACARWSRSWRPPIHSAGRCPSRGPTPRRPPTKIRWAR